jgi:hypothetical protein
MKKSQFIPGILFRLPQNKAIFRYEIVGSDVVPTNVVRQAGFDNILNNTHYHEIVNLLITRSTIQFFTGYGGVLMYSNKISFKSLEIVQPNSLKSRRLQQDR